MNEHQKLELNILTQIEGNQLIEMEDYEGLDYEQVFPYLEQFVAEKVIEAEEYWDVERCVRINPKRLTNEGREYLDRLRKLSKK